MTLCILDCFWIVVSLAKVFYCDCFQNEIEVLAQFNLQEKGCGDSETKFMASPGVFTAETNKKVNIRLL